jgi:hypothetical protein
MRRKDVEEQEQKLHPIPLLNLREREFTSCELTFSRNVSTEPLVS